MRSDFCRKAPQKYMLVLRTLLVCLFVLLLSTPSVAADDIAQTIKERYASLDTFQANFTQYLTHQESGQREKREGQLLFKRPLLIRWTTTAPTAEEIIVTDKEIWNYFPDEKIAYRYTRDLVNDSRSLIQIITGQSLLSQDFEVKDSGNEGKLRILTLYPNDPTPDLVEATLYVDPVKGYIQRAVITDFYGNKNDVRFTSFIPNADISARQLRFQAPSDVEIEDRISKPIEGRNLF